MLGAETIPTSYFSGQAGFQMRIKVSLKFPFLPLILDCGIRRRTASADWISFLVGASSPVVLQGRRAFECELKFPKFSKKTAEEGCRYFEKNEFQLIEVNPAQTEYET